MQKRFNKIIDDMKGLVSKWSAPSCECGISAASGSPDAKVQAVHDGGKFLVAVSGGVDSMVMADLFLRCCGPDGFALAHCNFNLRGEESDADTAHVTTWADGNGVRLHKASFDTEDYAKEHSVSIEMAARELRYRWFADLCREHSYLATAVAHNANDNAETLMLNLLRGTGMDGLSGMKAVSAFPFEGCSDVVLIRPLLEFTRKQIEGYAMARKISWRTDSTNLCSDYKRNRIRNEVFPQFGKINPSFVRTLNQDIEHFALAWEIVEDWCSAAAKTVVEAVPDSDAGVFRIRTDALLGYRQWKYLLYYLLSPCGFNSPQLESLENLLSSDRTMSGKRFESDSHVILSGRGFMDVLPKGSGQCRSCIGDMDEKDYIIIRKIGVYDFNGRRFKVSLEPFGHDAPLKQAPGVIAVDASALKFPFVLRRWRHGDWFRPLGLGGRKLLSDLFTDLKYSTIEKSSAVVVDTAIPTSYDGLICTDVAVASASATSVAALACLRIDAGLRITSSTSSVLRIEELLSDGH